MEEGKEHLNSESPGNSEFSINPTGQRPCGTTRPPGKARGFARRGASPVPGKHNFYRNDLRTSRRQQGPLSLTTPIPNYDDVWMKEIYLKKNTKIKHPTLSLCLCYKNNTIWKGYGMVPVLKSASPKNVLEKDFTRPIVCYKIWSEKNYTNVVRTD